MGGDTNHQSRPSAERRHPKQDLSQDLKVLKTHEDIMSAIINRYNPDPALGPRIR